MTATPDILSQALSTFMDESRDLLTQMEQILLRADEGRSTAEDLHALFRCAHTIKGSGGLFGLHAVERFTHVVENVLDRLRNGEMHFEANLISLLLDAQDHISALIDAVGNGGEVPPERGDALIARLQDMLDTGTGIAPSIAPPRATPTTIKQDQPATLHAWHLSLRFGSEVLRNGMDPLAFINYLGSLGTAMQVETILKALPEIAEIDPEQCYLGFEIDLESSASREEIEGVFDFVRDDATIVVTQAPAEESTDAPVLPTPVLPASEAAPTTNRSDPAGKPREEKRAADTRFVKVPADRLDALIDRVGELVIAGAGTHQQITRLGHASLNESAEQLLALVEDIRDMALGLRMVTIGEVFSRFPRVVRDVSRELGKDIELRISGADCELDKMMVDKIGDPLMHLVRNAMDHGIEPAETRTAQGKPAHGTVSLNAFHESGCIHIEVVDDGGGLDRERILKKAVEKGMLSPDARLADQDIYRLILAPGFSTAEKITNLSGRGVGMDVVSSHIEQLRGTLDIDSIPGQGTTFRLSLPLTLAIIDGFHVGVGHSHFIVPLDLVEECIELPPDIGGGECLDLRGEALPFIRLRELFGEGGAPHPRPRIIVVRFGNRRAGLVVDRVHGKCQTVIKPLGPLFAAVPAVSGSSIIGNGDVGLILDIPALIRQALDIRRAGQARTSHPQSILAGELS